MYKKKGGSQMSRVIKLADSGEEIKKFKKYLPMLEDIVLSPNVSVLQTVEDIKDAIKGKRMPHIALDSYGASLGIRRDGDNMVYIDLDKFEGLLKQLEKDYEKQKGGMFKSVVKDYAKLVLELQSQLEKRDKEITELLEFQKTALNLAAEKSRITAGESKKNFKNASRTIGRILEHRRNNWDKTKDVDVKKLQRVFYGRPEEYYNN